MEVLPVHVFKDSFSSLLVALNENELRYQLRQNRSAVPLASSGIVELLLSPGVWGPMAAMVVAFIRRRNGCKVIITTKENSVIHAEGLSEAELAEVLSMAKSIAIAERGSAEKVAESQN